MVRNSRLLPDPLLAVGLVVTLGVAPGRADAPAGGRPSCRCVAVDGALLRQQPDKSWQPIRAGDGVRAGDLLVALPYAELRSADGAVKLVLLADDGERGPLAVLEAGVRLNHAANRGLDVTLERGVLALANLRKAGATTARVRVAGAAWDLTLARPGTVVELELYSLHPPGLPL